jgi:hypothetical protein
MSLRILRSLAPSCIASALLLAACGQSVEEAESADDFASRINGAAPPATAGASTVENGTAGAPKIATPQPGAAKGPLEPGTMTDPAAQACGAPSGEDFLGKMYTPELGQRISGLTPQGGSVRVLKAGQGLTGKKLENRLNVMLDGNGIIRDFRCG